MEPQRDQSQISENDQKSEVELVYADKQIDWIKKIPATFSFRMKKFSNFIAGENQFDAKFSLFLDLDITDLPEDVVEQAEKKLRMRMHYGDWIYYVPTMSGKTATKLRIQFDKSGFKPTAQTSDFREAEATFPFDIYNYQIRQYEFTGFDYKKDEKLGILDQRYELKFDTKKNPVPILWATNVDAFPDFNICYSDTDVEVNSEGNEVIIKLTLARNPTTQMVKIFLPAVILALFNLTTFALNTPDDFADRQANISITLLTYVGMLNVLPSDIKSVTFADQFLYAYILSSLIPSISGVLIKTSGKTYTRSDSAPYFWTCAGINIFFLLATIVKFIYHHIHCMMDAPVFSEKTKTGKKEFFDQIGKHPPNYTGYSVDESYKTDADDAKNLKRF